MLRFRCLRRRRRFADLERIVVASLMPLTVCPESAILPVAGVIPDVPEIRL